MQDPRRRSDARDAVYTGLLIMSALGMLARVVLAMLFFGTNDMEAWTVFAQNLSAHALCDVYPNVVGMGGQFNHPPLIGLFAGGLWNLAGLAHVPFHVLFKLVPVLFDCATALVVYLAVRQRSDRRTAALAVAAYSAGLLSVLIAGVHGNTDAICAFFTVLALSCFDGEKFFAAGLALAAALNVKLIPVVILVALAFQVRDRRALLGLSAGLAVGLVPLLLVRDCPRIFFEKVVAYVPHHETWGLPYLLELGAHRASLARAMAGLSTRFFEIGRFLPLAGALFAALFSRWRRPSVFVLGALTFSLFLVGAVGFGVQYLLYLAPFLCIVDWRLGLVYGTAAGVFVAMVYRPFVSASAPYLIHMFGRIGPGPASIGLAVWLLVVVAVALLLVRSRRDGPQSR